MIAPAIVDEAARATCPEPDPADRREARSVVARPHPDVTGPDGRPYVSLGGLQQAIDERDVVIRRKNRTIDRLADQIEACRGRDGAAAPAA